MSFADDLGLLTTVIFLTKEASFLEAYLHLLSECSLRLKAFRIHHHRHRDLFLFWEVGLVSLSEPKLAMSGSTGAPRVGGLHLLLYLVVHKSSLIFLFYELNILLQSHKYFLVIGSANFEVDVTMNHLGVKGIGDVNRKIGCSFWRGSTLAASRGAGDALPIERVRTSFTASS